MGSGRQTSIVDLILLGMVQEQPRSAYDIQKQVQFRNLQHWVKMSIPSVYKKVFRLEEQGYISGAPAQEGKIEKTIYTITAEGRLYFQQLMEQTATAPTQVLFDFNGVIANLNKIPPEEALRLLREIRSQMQHMMEYLLLMQPRRAHVPLVGRAIMDQQLRVLQALLDWIESFTKEFSAEMERKEK